MSTTPTTPTADPLDAIRAAYRETLGVWTGWTWPDAPAGDLVMNGPGALATCQAWNEWEDACADVLRSRGTDAVEAEMVAEAMREYGERCQEDAETAAECVETAMEEAERGNLAEAILWVKDAMKLERPYGEGSYYYALHTALRAAERAEWEAANGTRAANP